MGHVIGAIALVGAAAAGFYFLAKGIVAVVGKVTGQLTRGVNR